MWLSYRHRFVILSLFCRRGRQCYLAIRLETARQTAHQRREHSAVEASKRVLRDQTHGVCHQHAAQRVYARPRKARRYGARCRTDVTIIVFRSSP